MPTYQQGTVNGVLGYFFGFSVGRVLAEPIGTILVPDILINGFPFVEGIVSFTGLEMWQLSWWMPLEVFVG